MCICSKFPRDADAVGPTVCTEPTEVLCAGRIDSRIVIGTQVMDSKD